ncbi:hypothetical protein [Nitrospirillum sp. BR 11163]|uniref:hypothetical protein n=1 Tax=Nitrospirillum sp. BR 11163 TaxID=3104323 RepID=UPI002AFDE1E6|nr:hypothetical protein [Nitrospirillum sp. BR 11163]MEA1672419.1 hypothetical protein [Nitrospirillum sp. BR 11163]
MREVCIPGAAVNSVNAASALLTFAPVPLVMILAAKLVDKPYRVVWPQPLAAAFVWPGWASTASTG